ncbi:MAG: neutral/alkaline non-lysosomal ceramidase N-terminal domain-containing protein [Gemmataceae bacterium]|nr:neutral/alkaline non-lysosomal ceramidase N-terminal domain-containing protein [Gemmataceae bacterium]
MALHALTLLMVLPLGVKAGAARCDITPPTGYPMWGYAARRDGPSVGVLDKLHARTLVLEAGKDRLALVSLDLGRAPPRGSYERLKAQARKLGVTALFLAASHTHHGPVLESDDWPTPKTSYVRSLEEKIIALIADACKALKPARIGTASKESALNRNRHSKRADAPVDRELLVLRVEDADGKAIATAVGFAAHPTMQPAKVFKFSADWPGAMAAEVEKRTGAPCLFLQGAAGDLSPNPRKDERGPEKFGKAVADEALKLKVECAALPKAVLKAREDEFSFKSRVPLDNEAVKAALSLAFYPALVEFFEKEYKDGIRPRLATALLGEIAFVGVSAEVFCSHSLHLKRRARLPRLFFIGYCNDYHQYLPTIEAASEGGYGTEAWISPAAVGSGERVMDRALLRLYGMRGRIAE